MGCYQGLCLYSPWDSLFVYNWFCSTNIAQKFLRQWRSCGVTCDLCSSPHEHGDTTKLWRWLLQWGKYHFGIHCRHRRSLPKEMDSWAFVGHTLWSRWRCNFWQPLRIITLMLLTKWMIKQNKWQYHIVLCHQFIPISPPHLTSSNIWYGITYFSHQIPKIINSYLK